MCESFDKFVDDIKFGSAIHSLCIADWGMICNDPMISAMICPANIPAQDLCPLYSGGMPGFPDKCTGSSSAYDKCAQDWKSCLNDKMFNFCVSFPELCASPFVHVQEEVVYAGGIMPAIPGTKVFSTFEEIEAAICKHDKDKFCKGGAVLNFNKACMYEFELPMDVVINTSLYSVCAIDTKKACKDNTKVCPDGKSIGRNLCSAYPEKCDENVATTYDKCALDWKNCLIRIDFHFCMSFPALCKSDLFAPTLATFETWAEIESAVCDFDKKRYCRGTEIMNVLDTCKYFHELPYELTGGTSLGSLCWSADFEAMCGELEFCPTGDISKDLCFSEPDRCDETNTMYNKCAADWQACMTDETFDFCAVFPEACFPPPEVFDVSTIPDIPDANRIDYGAPFFKRPAFGGSETYDYTDSLKLMTCEFELIEPMSVASKIIGTAMIERQIALFPGSTFTPSIK